MHVIQMVVSEVDPTVRPVIQSFYVFVFLAVATILLLLSFRRHVRRAQDNLGSAREPGPDESVAATGGPGEGDAR